MNFNKYKYLAKKLDVNISKIFLTKNIKKLFFRKQKPLGRSYGRIVMDHKGGGLKRMYRSLLPSFESFEEQFVVIRSIEKDPNRSAFIGLAQTREGYFFNILVNSTAKVGDIFFVNKSLTKNLYLGDVSKLRYVTKNVPLYNLEKYPGSGSVYSKTAGTHSFLLAKYFKYAKIRLPSGEERLFDLNCAVTVGVPSNSFSFLNKKYKAGTNRLLNKRPVVRGTAKNPIDHPHGGGAGKTAPGRPSVSPWGKLTKGVPTRSKKKVNKLIIKRA